MSITQIASKINESLESKSNMKIGEIITHPDGRTVKIKSGQFLDPVYKRVSNFWTWNEVFPDGSLGEDESGYGW